ncbi:Uncharacterised protein [Mycobacterium tuberculosis]|nr:Uncharacterised protein [Mycobacterium tuberculosis]
MIETFCQVEPTFEAPGRFTCSLDTPESRAWPLTTASARRDQSWRCGSGSPGRPVRRQVARLNSGQSAAQRHIITPFQIGGPLRRENDGPHRRMNSVGGHRHIAVHRRRRRPRAVGELRADAVRVLLESGQPVPDPCRVGAERLAQHSQQDAFESSAVKCVDPRAQLADLLTLLLDLAADLFMVQPQSRCRPADSCPHDDHSHGRFPWSLETGDFLAELPRPCNPDGDRERPSYDQRSALHADPVGQIRSCGPRSTAGRRGPFAGPPCPSPGRARSSRRVPGTAVR